MFCIFIYIKIGHPHCALWYSFASLAIHCNVVAIPSCPTPFSRQKISCSFSSSKLFVLVLTLTLPAKIICYLYSTIIKIICYLYNSLLVLIILFECTLLMFTECSSFVGVNGLYSYILLFCCVS